MKYLEPANSLLSDPLALRVRADRDGCLLLCQVFDTESLLALRRQILELCESFGWLAYGSSLMDGIANFGATPEELDERFMALYSELLKLEDFHALAHYPALVHAFEKLFGESVLIHPRNIARIIFPQNVKHTTPAHQDFVHIQGTPDTWTAWTPLGDCPIEQGALAFLIGSHKQGIYPTHQAYGAGGLGIETDELPFEWRTWDFKIGDTVIFHSHNIHKALPNLTADRIRLSVDYRYQPVSQPVTEGSLLPHMTGQSWEDIYKGWRRTELQYYWEAFPLKLADWSGQYHQKAAPGG
ncbi:MAG: phytanoyl-CoA dioxygenase family protein [Armatimonadetes bacterium]|nr:phytanoyl-CoA dioxygenase family protein [Armatimonadota bacterium]